VGSPHRAGVLVALLAPLLAVEPFEGGGEAPPWTHSADPQPSASGYELLERATGALGRGEYERALEIAVPALSAYPDLAASFQAVIDVAHDQIARRPPGPPGSPELSPPPLGAEPPPRFVTTWVGERPLGPTKIGFEVGLPTGLRVEWDTAMPLVSDLGFRVGGNVLAYGPYGVADLTGFVDLHLAEPLEIELSAGLVLVYLYLPLPQAGAAIQIDPEGPLHVNLGARVALYYGTVPDVNVGFVW
jgi:hypothetical protein